MRSSILALSFAALLAGCMPKIETRRVDTPYPLRDFHGPATVPEAPVGTLRETDLNGYWRVVAVRPADGDSALSGQLGVGMALRVGTDRIVNVQGLPPEFLVPVAAQWRLNRVDGNGAVLGFGFDQPNGRLNFLHYAFVMAGVDRYRALAHEVMHFEESVTGAIRWTIWEIELELMGAQPPVRGVPPLNPVWPE